MLLPSSGYFNATVGSVSENSSAAGSGLLDCPPIPVRECVKEAGFGVVEYEMVRMRGIPSTIILAGNP